MRTEGLVGIVIPAFNAAEWVAQALTSVIAQTYRPIDVIVVDDGSTDATSTIAEGHQSGDPAARVRVTIQAHGGVGAARNRGAALVSGDLLAFHDADDLCARDGLASRVAVLRARAEVDLVFGHERRFASIDEGGPVALGGAQPSCLPGSMLVRRDAFARVGEFDTRLGVAEGLEWMLRARDAGLRSVTLPAQVRWRRVHANLSLIHI